MIIVSFNLITQDKMNHTTTTKNVALIGMLAAITAAALTGTIAISIIQNAAAQTTDLENSGTNFKLKEKDKNNCGGFTFCCNIASQSIAPPAPPILPCIIPRPPPP
jgi:hypothetical protein